MHILIVKLSSIGDVVHALPAVSALRHTFPEARLTWVVEQFTSPLILGSPILDDVIVVDTRTWRRSITQTSTWYSIYEQLNKVKRLRPDIAIDFQGLLKSALISRLSGAKKRVGFTRKILRESISSILYTHQINVEKFQHVIDQNLALTYSLGVVPVNLYEFPFPPLELESSYIEDQLAKYKVKKFVIINPGGGWITKLWPAENYGKLADLIWKKFGFQSIVTCGPGEERLVELILQNTTSGQVFYFPTKLLEFVALVKRAELFVGSDTGPLHLATACKIPVVGIYGPTESARNGPFDPLDQTIGREISCRINCYRRKCDNHICMEIPVEKVINAIEIRLFGLE